MTVIEYDGRIVVVDTGLMFPTAEMLGIDLVLPDFSYLRGRPTTSRRSSSPTATRTTSAPCRSSSARSASRRRSTAAGSRSAWSARSSRSTSSRTCRCSDLEPGDAVERRAVRDRDASTCRTRSPTPARSRSHTDLGTVLITGDYKFDQTPVDGRPADFARLAELGEEGLLCLCGDSTNADRPGVAMSESSVGAGAARDVLAAATAGSSSPASPRTSIASSRSSTPPSSSAARSRSSAARCGRTSTSPRTSGSRTHPSGLLIQPREIEDYPDDEVVAISTGSQGEPLSALRRMAARRAPRRPAALGRHRRLLGHADARQRALGQRDGRPHLRDRRPRRSPPPTRRSTPPATATRRT